MALHNIKQERIAICLAKGLDLEMSVKFALPQVKANTRRFQTLCKTIKEKSNEWASDIWERVEEIKGLYTSDQIIKMGLPPIKTTDRKQARKVEVHGEEVEALSDAALLGPPPE